MHLRGSGKKSAVLSHRIVHARPDGNHSVYRGEQGKQHGGTEKPRHRRTEKVSGGERTNCDHPFHRLQGNRVYEQDVERDE